jgi:hypothetical protein
MFLRNKKSLSEWVVDLHNAINKNNQKHPIDYESIRQQYETSANMCTNPSKTGSYTNLLQGQDDDSVGDLLITTPHAYPFSIQEIAIAAVVILVIIMACAVAIRHHCESCAAQ